MVDRKRGNNHRGKRGSWDISPQLIPKKGRFTFPSIGIVTLSLHGLPVRSSLLLSWKSEIQMIVQSAPLLSGKRNRMLDMRASVTMRPLSIRLFAAK